MFEPELNDPLDDLLSGAVVPAPRKAPPASYAPKDFSEPCPKCRGTGTFYGYSGRAVGKCFTCKGAGKKTYKSSSTDRAKARAGASSRKASKAAANLAAFAEANPEIAKWLAAAAERGNRFASSLAEGIGKFGDLTEGQKAAVEKILASDAAKAEAKAKAIAEAPEVAAEGIDKLKAAFDQAIAYSAEKGLKLSPKITVGGTTISPAKANSRNPGALYVKSGGEYLGKIASGKFYASAACSEEQKAKVLEFVANPAEAAKVYGQTTGTCCVCNATLRSEWKLRGIGPICAEKFGW